MKNVHEKCSLGYLPLFVASNRENAELFQGSPFGLNYQGIAAALGTFLIVRYLPPYAKQFFSGKSMRKISLDDKAESRLWNSAKLFGRYGVSVAAGVVVSTYARETRDNWRVAADFPLHSGPRSIAVTAVCPRAARLWNEILKEHNGSFTPQSEKLKSIQRGVQNCVTWYEFEDYLRQKMNLPDGQLVVVPPPGVPTVEDTETDSDN